jgi:hypothetical protein
MTYRRTVLGGAAFVLLVGAVTAFTAAGRTIEIPFGWTAIGDSSYDITVDTGLHVGGRGYTVATIRSNRDLVAGTGVLQQSIRANDFRGQRILMTGYMKARANDADANMFMRVDGASAVLTSDYMENRPIRGTTDWTQYSIVVDVPSNAIGLTFGFSLVGSGQAWLDDVAIEVVDQSVAVTGHPLGWGGKPMKFGPGGRAAYENAPRTPINLDFEQKLIASR